jgi:hypothetical protein
MTSLYMRSTCSVSVLKLKLHVLQKFVFILICAEYGLYIFNATSDKIHLMAFYLKPNCMEVSLENDFRQVLKFV